MTRANAPRVTRPCRGDEFDTVLAIVNDAAQAYRDVIPADRWHDPYMPADALRAEIAAGVAFTACEIDGEVAGVMGGQSVRNVDLIRHAYVRPVHQGRGVGAALLGDLTARTTRPILVGAWTAATWAGAFYERHGFRLVPDDVKAPLLRTYWTVSERQIETSVVRARPMLTVEGAIRLIDGADISP